MSSPYFVLTPQTSGQTDAEYAQYVQSFKDQGLYVVNVPRTDANGNEVTDAKGNVVMDIVAMTMPQYTVNVGIAALFAQDAILADNYDTMTKQVDNLVSINNALQAVSSLKAGMSGPVVLSADLQKSLKDLVDKKILSLGDGVNAAAYLAKQFDSEMLDTLRTNLTTAQSSQSALNENMSLTLNDAASKRSAILTQLQTLLQTMMQTQQQLARW